MNYVPRSSTAGEAARGVTRLRRIRATAWQAAADYADITDRTGIEDLRRLTHSEMLSRSSWIRRSLMRASSAISENAVPSARGLLCLTACLPNKRDITRRFINRFAQLINIYVLVEARSFAIRDSATWQRWRSRIASASGRNSASYGCRGGLRHVSTT